MGILDGWRHCPRCGGPVSVAAGRATCELDGVVAYANPKPTACALVADDQGRLLLGRRAFDPCRGLWDTPGGFVEEGEHPLAALVRELREETGLDVEPGRFVGVRMDAYGTGPGTESTLNLYWEAHVVGGELQPGDDVAELHWFAPAELPAPEELAFRTVADALEAWLEARPD